MNNSTIINSTIIKSTIIPKTRIILSTLLTSKFTDSYLNSTKKYNQEYIDSTSTNAFIIICSIIGSFIIIYVLAIIINICKLNNNRNRVSNTNNNNENNNNITSNNENRLPTTIEFSRIQQRNLHFLRNSIRRLRERSLRFSLNRTNISATTTTTITTNLSLPSINHEEYSDTYSTGSTNMDLPPDYNFDKPPDYTEIQIIETRIIESRI